MWSTIFCWKLRWAWTPGSTIEAWWWFRTYYGVSGSMQYILKMTSTQVICKNIYKRGITRKEQTTNRSSFKWGVDGLAIKSFACQFEIEALLFYKYSGVKERISFRCQIKSSETVSAKGLLPLPNHRLIPDVLRWFHRWCKCLYWINYVINNIVVIQVINII